MITYMENYFMHRITAADKCINLILGAVLRLRGSKKLFYSVDSAKRYLDKINGRSEKIVLHGKYKSQVREFYCETMQCFSFRSDAACEKTVIYLPGGAFVRQPSVQHFKFADRLCRATVAEIIICIYPKAPEHTYSKTLAAVAELYRQLLDAHTPEDIIIGDDSAGGTVAALLPAFFAENSLPQLSKMFLFSPMLSLSLDINNVREIEHKDPMLSVDGLKYFAQQWYGEKNGQNDPAAVSLDNMPKIYCFCGKTDILTFYSENFFEKMKKAKKPFELHVFDGMYHVSPLYPLKAAREVFGNVCRFIKE